MKESRFSVHKVCSHDGHEIRVEKRSLFFTMECSLIIDGTKQDQLLGTYGLFILHGVIDEAGSKIPVEPPQAEESASVCQAPACSSWCTGTRSARPLGGVPCGHQRLRGAAGVPRRALRELRRSEGSTGLRACGERACRPYNRMWVRLSACW